MRKKNAESRDELRRKHLQSETCSRFVTRKWVIATPKKQQLEMYTQLNGNHSIDRKSEQPKNTMTELELKRIRLIKQKAMHITSKPSRTYYGEKAQKHVNADHEQLRHMRRQLRKKICHMVKHGRYIQN